MHAVIKVKNLERIFKIHKKQEGIKESFVDLFHRKYIYKEAVKGINFSIERGSVTRCFTYVSDAVEGTIKAILRKKGELFEIFNICSDFSYTVKEVADIVLSCSDMKPKIKYCSFQDVNRKEEYEVYNRILSSEKGKRILDYQAKIPLEDGVKRTFEFYKRESELLR